MNFVLINPYNFPIVHPPYGYFAHPPKKLLNLIEQEINNVGPCSILIHYPVDFFMWKKNRKGNTFGKIMKIMIKTVLNNLHYFYLNIHI